ncbi:MAG: hypothetical protein MjAS7_2287 [Metallosphaera javensis (ex Sakai et al. 2022)]|nr:MAG: hypothetical protein MjAS7_2287 [Metallosphaera javensis (ex Sakai et al. 2022)]
MMKRILVRLDENIYRELVKLSTKEEIDRLAEDAYSGS